MANHPLTWKPPVIALTQAEVDEMRQQIADGILPPDAFELYAGACEKQVFGFDVQHDSAGNPIEQGVGSASQPSRNSIDSYRTTQLNQKGGPEAGFEQHLARMEAQLAEFEKTQAAKRSVSGHRGRA